ncbi:MAG TPA: CPBP family glutamic-type intramembrane protease [Gammaproteobacteria bacterium]|nr:CPBP family glutamic-type intramembrane protease [Gammaproteobacteria bacterium]
MNRASTASILNYLKYNLLGGLGVFPRRGLGVSALVFLIYVLLVIPTGLGSDVIKPRLAEWTAFLYMPFTLLIFPSLLEEAFFRGLLIPRNTGDGGKGRIVFFTLLSSLLFTVWHPLNALTINPGAAGIFLDPWFLFITFLLGLTCSLGYIYTRSLWAPVLMHWLTVLVWVLFLGGHNLLLR